MKRLGRWLFNGVAAISLLLFVATAGLWVRSYIGDGGGLIQHLDGKKYHMGMSKGLLALDFMPDGNAKFLNGTLHDAMGVTLVTGTKGGSRFAMLLLPLWMPAVFFLLLPMIWLARWYWRCPTDTGRCPVCGYDLRATPERCPECGTIAVEKKTISN